MTKSRWRAWYEWCRLHRVDPLHCTSPELCEYLVSVFDSGKAVSTVRGHLSAIATTIRLSTKRDIVAGNVRLTAMLQGFVKQRPVCHVTVPKWDLTLILMALRNPPYEPLHKATRKSVTLKAAFLTQLALAARPCELAKFSRLVGVTRRGCTLTPLPGATLKSTNPETVRMMRDVFVPSLYDISGGIEEEMLLCPVRVLRRYEEMVATLRVKGQPFFLPYSGSRGKVSANTISTWIRTVIRDAYGALGPADLKLAGRTAHEVRALAASWAEFNNVPLIDILSNCNWKSPTLFSSCYYRDLASISEAMAAVGTIVTAGRVITPAGDTGALSRP